MLSLLFKFILGILRFLLSAVWGVVALFTLLFAIGFFMGNRPAEIKPKSFLVMDWSEGVVERPQADTSLHGRILAHLGLGSDRGIPLWDFHTALERAAKDDRIVGLFMTGNASDSGTGLAQLFEARAAIQAFRASGKPVISYFQLGTAQDYYILSATDQFLMHPHGVLVFSGMSMESPFFFGAMERYGVGLQEARVGKYKSALEPFTRAGFSPENRESQQALIDDLWGQLVADIAVSRHLTSEEVQALSYKAPIWDARDVKGHQLVDELVYFDQVLDFLMSKGSEDIDIQSFAQVNMFDYAREALSLKKGLYGVGPKIAIVYAEGSIVDGEGTPDQIGGDHLAHLLRALRKDDDIAGVVLRINSGGGSALASEVISREVGLVSAAKPLVVSFGDVAASGGYWIAMEAPTIFASPVTITGSIGNFSFATNLQALAHDHGVTFDGVKTGSFAGCMQTYTRPRTPEEMAHLQQFVANGYQQFIEKVAAGRHLSLEAVEAVAQGRVWSGVRAKDLALIDHFGSLKAAAQAVASQLKVDKYQIVHVGPDYSLCDRLANYGQGWFPFVQLVSAYKPFIEQLTHGSAFPEAKLIMTQPKF